MKEDFRVSDSTHTCSETGCEKQAVYYCEQCRRYYCADHFYDEGSWGECFGCYENRN